MATLASLGFEIERRVIIFHRDTTLPDDTQLGYTGNPNDAINGNTNGETLLYNSPSGTQYLDKGLSIYERWTKVEDTPGGLWELVSGESVANIIFEAESFELTPLQISNMYVQLTYQPLVPEDVEMTIKNAPVQYYGDDYKQDVTFLKRITWEGLELESSLSVGDKITITYTR